MRLPKEINYSIHEILVPSYKRNFKFRPFLVKEYKALLLAESSANPVEKLDTLTAIVQNCCLDDDPLDVKKLAVFDFEYLLIKLRAISVGNEVPLDARCQFDEAHKDKPERTRHTEVYLNLDNVKVVGLENYNTEIKLDDKTMVIMKPPTVEFLSKIRKDVDKDNLELLTEQIALQIDKIATDEEVYPVADSPDFSLKDVEEWLENLNNEQFNRLNAYFHSIPYCCVELEWTCPDCGNLNRVVLQGLDYFF